ncbi:uncharacterized protein LOC108917123 [Anoplophora glabripennis]|uniref:uncharacterized protein LOC108917123 n=1 Tax=Anoplophora glabripennis TaxID=217634 RepID=UPI00087378DB|nr:uncharacterized protein LOC108917123 [Anoplophora glabripennis]
MEKIPSKASRVSDAISTTDSCPETNCARGSKKNDGACAPCCVTKLPGKVSSRRSKSMMTDSDFEKIKDQLRKARKKLDEAVAMVSRTVSSSSYAFSAGRLTSETDAFPSSSYNAARTSKKPSFEPTKFHNFQNCPLRDMTNMTSAYNRFKNTTESALCLDSCSSVQIPPCVSKEALKKKPEQQQSFFRRTIDLNPSTTTCTPMLPCDIPSITSRREVPPPSSAKSLPTSSTKIDGSQRRINLNRGFIDFTASKDERYRRPREKDDRKGNIDCATKQARSGEFNALCSTMCLNMDPPPCTIEETLKKRSEELQNLVRTLSASANLSSVPCTPMLPCDMLPDSGYVRFNRNIDRKRMNMCKASQTDALDPLCSNMCLNTDPPPCKAEEIPNRYTGVQPSSYRPSASPKPTTSVTPGQSCVSAAVQSERSLPTSSTKIEESPPTTNNELNSTPEAEVKQTKTNEGEANTGKKEPPMKQDIKDVTLAPNNEPLEIKKDSKNSENDTKVRNQDEAEQNANEENQNEPEKKQEDKKLSQNCSTDPSSCTLEEHLRKKSMKGKDSLDRLPSAFAVPCKPMFPCEIPSVASRKDIDRPPPPWSTKSLPTSSTRIIETLQSSSSSSRTNDNSGYRFRDDIDVDRRQADKQFTSSRIHGSGIYDTYIVNPSPYASQETSTMVIGTQQSSHEPLAKSSSFVVPCTPMFPCDIPSIMSREKVWTDEDDEGRKPVVEIPFTKRIILGSKTNAGKCDSFSNQDVAASCSKNEFNFKTNSDKNSGYKPDQFVKNKSVIGKDGRFVSNQNQMVKTILKSTSEEYTNDPMTKPRDVEKKVSKTHRVVFQNK